MPLFVLYCRDKAGALQTRLDNREAHLAYLNARGGVKLAGPLLDEAGEPAGSMLVIEAADLAAAKAFAADDPYAQAGLFERVEMQAFRVTLGQL